VLPATDFLLGGIVVFDIGGNNYRISANVRYVNERSRVGRVYITTETTPMTVTTLDLSTPHVLRTEAEHDAAAAEMLALLDRAPEPGTPEDDRLEFLTALVHWYDINHVRFGEDDPATPQEMVDFMLEQRGMARADLSELMGGRSRVSDFFNGKRDLSLGQIYKLRDLLRIPADMLLPREPVKRRPTAAAKAPRRRTAKAGVKKSQEYAPSRARAGAPKR